MNTKIISNMSSLHETTSDKKISKDINKFSLIDILELYNDNKFNGIDESTIEIMIKSLVLNIRLLVLEPYLKLLSLDIIKILLEREDYIESKYFPLEKHLMNLVILFFKMKWPEETKENKKDFLECVDKLRFDVIYQCEYILDDLMHITTTDYYKNNIDIQKEISYKIVKTLANKSMDHDPERHSNKKTLKSEEIKIGDVLDICNNDGDWFVGKIINKQIHNVPNKGPSISDMINELGFTGFNDEEPSINKNTNSYSIIEVSFDGLPNEINESLLGDYLTFAKLGTYTNGKFHNATEKEQCDCMQCRYVIKEKTYNDLGIVSYKMFARK
jgi:hypothetical protein